MWVWTWLRADNAAANQAWGREGEGKHVFARFLPQARRETVSTMECGGRTGCEREKAPRVVAQRELRTGRPGPLQVLSPRLCLSASPSTCRPHDTEICS